MTEKKVMKLASRGKRFGAACIDLVVPCIAYLIYVAVLAANGMLSSQRGYGYGNDFGYGYGYGYGYNYNYGYDSRHLSGASATILGVVALLLIVYIIVECVFYAKGKSIGKALLGLQVVSSVDGKPFRFWKMMLRECIVKNASGTVLALGFIWILIDEKNRGWHDKILDSYVVDLKESEKIHLKRSLEHAEDMAYKAERAAVARDTSPAAEQDEEIMAAPAAALAEPVTEAADVTDVTETFVPEEDTVIEVEAELIDDAADDAEAAGDAAGAAAVSMSMKKEELLETARSMGIKVNSRATKAEIIEAIEKAGEE